MPSPGRVRPYLNVLQRQKLRVKHGVMEPNWALECLRRYPPPPVPPNKPLEEIEFPWEKLEKAYEIKREEEGVASPYVPIEAPDLDPGADFARRQLKRMLDKDEDEETARKNVEAEDEAEKQAAIRQIDAFRAKCRQWHRGQVGAPFDKDEHLTRWGQLSQRLDKRPFIEWTTEEKTDVDALLTSALKLPWRIERFLDEEAAYVDTWGVPKDAKTFERVSLALHVAKLRVEAFWPKLVDPHASQLEPDCDDPLDKAPRELYLDAEGEDDGSSGLGAVFDRIQSRAEAKPLSAWTVSEVEELDAWIRDEFCSGEVGVSDLSGRLHIDASLPIERLRLELFPELCPTYKRPDPTRFAPLTATTGGVLSAARSTPTSWLHPPLVNDGAPDDDDAAVSGVRKGGGGEEEEEPLFDATGHPTHSPDAAPIVHVRTYRGRDQLQIALARAGQFPDLDVEDILRHDANCTSDQDKYLTDEMAEALRDAREPDSHERRRVAVARKAHRDRRFMDRIYRKLEETDPFELAWQRRQAASGGDNNDDDDDDADGRDRRGRRGGEESDSGSLL